MCDGADASNPCQWNMDCATRKCRNCPSPTFPVPVGREKETVSFSLWTTKDIDGRKQFNLFQVSKTLEELAKELADDIVAVTRHVFSAALSWAKLRKDVEELRPDIDVVCIEDYQRNVEIFHSEAPTSVGYSANSVCVAMYPIGIRYRKRVGEAAKTAALVLVTDDLHHDHQQVGGIFKEK